MKKNAPFSRFLSSAPLRPCGPALATARPGQMAGSDIPGRGVHAPRYRGQAIGPADSQEPENEEEIAPPLFLMMLAAVSLRLMRDGAGENNKDWSYINYTK